MLTAATGPDEVPEVVEWPAIEVEAVPELGASEVAEAEIEEDGDTIGIEQRQAAWAAGELIGHSVESEQIAVVLQLAEELAGGPYATWPELAADQDACELLLAKLTPGDAS